MNWPLLILSTGLWTLAPALVFGQRVDPGEQDPVPVDPETEEPLPVDPRPVEEMLAEPASEGGAEGTPQTFDRRVVARITVEYLELQKGPGPAYVSNGRAYQNDRVVVKQRSADGRWYEVEAGGIRGWVPTNSVELVREDVRRGRDGKADAGRDRRQTNYRYDAEGRRVGPDGQPVGSGEGTADEADEAAADLEADYPLPGTERPTLRLFAGVGVARVGREFGSNIVADGLGPSALSILEVESLAISSALAATWTPMDHFAVAGRFRDHRFADTTIPANATFGFDRPVTLSMDAQQIELDAIGRYPVADYAFGAYAGLRLLRHAFQQTNPYPLFLTNTFTSLGAGGVVEADFGVIELSLQGGVNVPLAVSQAPAAGGDASAFGYDGALTVTYSLTSAWGIYLDGHFQQIDTDYEGRSEHVDNVTADDPRSYTQAREKDRVLGGGLGVRWSN